MKKESEPKYKKVVEGANDLSLGLSIVAAILIGIGLGILMEKISHIKWLFWLGVFWGVAAAILNIYKAYKKQKIELDKLAKDPKYVGRRFDDEDDED